MWKIYKMASIQLNLVSGVGKRYFVNLQSFSRNYCFIPFFFKQTTLAPSNIIIIIIIVNLIIIIAGNIFSCCIIMLWYIACHFLLSLLGLLFTAVLFSLFSVLFVKRRRFFQMGCTYYKIFEARLVL